MGSRSGDTRFLPERGLPGDARLYIPNEGDGARSFESLTAASLRVRRDRTRIVVLVGALALLLFVAGLAFWVLRPLSDTSGSPTIETTSSTLPTAEPEAQERLSRLLPPAYPAGSCKPAPLPKDAMAQVYCDDENAEPGGPRWATFTLVPNKTALDVALKNLVESSATVVCPGNIQSPGPWRRNASPEQISGVLYCGMQEGRETVAWTDESKLLLSTIQTSPQGPSFAQLYAWWSSHS